MVFEHTLFCAIAPDSRETYASSLVRWLRPGGHFLAIHFVFPLSEQGPPYGADREEIIRHFEPNFQLLEDWSPRSFKERQSEERMFWWQKKP